MPDSMDEPLLTYDRFIPGQVLRSTPERASAEMLAQWQRLYPWDRCDAGALPAGMATALMMRAYMRTLTPRPPGNVHLRQELQLLGGIAASEPITTEFECVGKEIRRDRRYVELAVRGLADAGRPVFSGRMTMIWAA